MCDMSMRIGRQFLMYIWLVQGLAHIPPRKGVSHLRLTRNNVVVASMFMNQSHSINAYQHIVHGSPCVFVCILVIYWVHFEQRCAQD